MTKPLISTSLLRAYRKAVLAVWVTALISGGCVFDRSGFGGPGGGEEAGVGPDAHADGTIVPDADGDGGVLPDGQILPDGALQCQNGQTMCVSNQTWECQNNVWVNPQSCSMACAPDQIRCLELDPSNVASGVIHSGTEPLLVTGQWIVETDTGRIYDPNGPELRPPGQGLIEGIHFATDDSSCQGMGVFVMTGLTIQSGAELRAQGIRSLVLLVDGPVEIRGSVSVSAALRQPGAGGYTGGDRGDPGLGPCPGQPGAYYQSISDSGGGGGGHEYPGGPGANAGNAVGGAGGTGGCGADTLTPLCGGSGGGGQYGPDFGNRGSEGGAGGGAVQISSAHGISVFPTGVLTAGGGGGSGGHPGGGGGGGAGGAILLEAPAVLVEGTLSTTGGGGGSGGYNPDGLPGTDGEQGGAGGPTTSYGSAGGNGGGGTTPTGAPGWTHSNNAGAGGGAAGRIRLNAWAGSIQITGTTSPTPVSQGPVATH
jgi:hypothetical protein